MDELKTYESEIEFFRFISEIKSFTDSFTHLPNVPFYRGCSNCEYKLIPSLFRNQDKFKQEMEITALENNLFYDFCSYGDGIINEKNDWSVLFKMQHHEFPTRLLDWTESLGVALYFALEFSDNVVSPCIWVLDPYYLNSLEQDKKRFTELDYSTLYNPSRDFAYSYYDGFITSYIEKNERIFSNPLALYPVKSNERIRKQWGVFTIHGKDERCIQEIIGDEYLKQFPIPEKAIPAAKEFLRIASINHFSMYPDLEGLKKHLKTEYYK